MHISQGWKWKISSVGGVLETVKQAQTHEITFRCSGSKAETQELCEDIRWILCLLFRKKYWSGEVFVEQLNGHHETFVAQFIKLIISGEMPIGPESHQDSWFWSNKQLFSDGYCERPCSV